jgi:hypothetical protein
MVITATIRRTPSQRVRATLYCWTAQNGQYELCHVEWDPSGPLDAKTAAAASLGRLIRALELQGHEITAG